MHSRKHVIGAALALYAALSAISTALAQQSAPDAPHDVAQVVIVQQRFLPARLTVKAGTTVTWVNSERRTGHAVRASGRDGFQSPLLMPGQSWAHRFDKPGLFAYSCGPHPEMRGLVEVTE